MEQYTVQAGDSLWKISRRFGIDINDLTRVNGLNTKAKQHIIHPEQVLVIPSKEKTYDTQLNLNICDLRWRPLKDARLKLTFDGKTHDYITDGSGSVAGILIEDSTKGIKVELQHLDRKQYIVIANHPKAPLGNKTLRINSREMVVKGNTLVKTGTQQSTKQQEKEKAKRNSSPSTTSTAPPRAAANIPQASQTQPINQTTRTEGGIPTSVSNIGNVSGGLRLPPQAEQYRDYIIEAARKYDFQPEGLAALINAESSWRSNARNSTGSGAVGLGQFKKSAWLEGSGNPASKVYQRLNTQYPDRQIAYENRNIYYIDSNERKELITNQVLALRTNAEYSIDMVGLYDRKGVDAIGNIFPAAASLTPDELVKLAYLVHHEGVRGAYDIIMDGQGTRYDPFDDAVLGDRAATNIAARDLPRYQSIDSNDRTTYVAWLAEFIDTCVVAEHFRVLPKGENPLTKGIIKKLNPAFNRNIDVPPRTVQPANRGATQNNTASAGSGTDNRSSTSQSSGNNSTTSTNAASAGQWHNPLAICRIRTHRLARGAFGASFGRNRRTDSNGHPKNHQGVDIAADSETPIYAVADGRVAFIKDVREGGKYGKQLCIVVQVDDLPSSKKTHYYSLTGEFHPREIYFFYAHLSAVSANLSRHSAVKSGDVIGKTGTTGNAGGMTTIALGGHLHFEVRAKNPPGAGLADRIDPAGFIDGFNYP
ncbi:MULTISPECIES: LysM peptidoglycan-binding domain-containing M23 family metallopeptidase [unclassified Serratia (in: enterobacteria)]|uniref:LysM peptidoglycan-binding domain-containing M23 family metallopeptidase n=1 Tax=unclassified Serratia (in: enterobacteria) TaxID=2647522 RepID=UPI0030764EB2